MTFRRLLLAALAAMLFGSPAFAENPYRVRDINPGSSGSDPDQTVPIDFKGLLIFSADNGTDGFELWRSDGTDAGTSLVKNIRSGSDSSFPDKFAVMGDFLFFSARTSSTDFELWKSDGTDAGTERVKDINAGLAGSDPDHLTPLNGLLLFSAVEGVDDRGLYHSNGEDAGTTKTLEINSNPGVSGGDDGVAELTRVGNTVFFSARDSTGDIELWKTDGTPGGTVRVKDINTAGSSEPGQLTAMDDVLYFAATDASFDRELWMSDGTDAGTALVADIHPAGASSPSELTALGDTLFFVAEDGTNGSELWQSDGTAPGTQLVKNIFPGGDGSFPGLLTPVGDTLFFVADDGTTGLELWKSDGTEAGTAIVRDINPNNPAGSEPLQLTGFDGTLFFSADDGSIGRELWRSDGTQDGTVLVRDLNPNGGASPEALTVAGGRLFFAADEDNNLGRELYAIAVNLPHLANIATRARVGTGDNVMIAGIIIEGGRKRVIIRAKGPSLDDFGVPDTLNDPQLGIFSGPNQIAFNDDWRDSQETEIEASGLEPTLDVESAIILELDAGPYTAIVSGGAGNAIVEVFELD